MTLEEELSFDGTKRYDSLVNQTLLGLSHVRKVSPHINEDKVSPEFEVYVLSFKITLHPLHHIRNIAPRLSLVTSCGQN